jgi:hypothetical protein
MTKPLMTLNTTPMMKMIRMNVGVIICLKSRKSFMASPSVNGV